MQPPSLTIAEKRHVKRQFSMTLANLSQVEFYWSPAVRRVMARATSGTRKFALPRDAVLIGLYAPPFACVEFLGDLEDVLAELTRMESLKQPAQSTLAARA